jgi:hypothetical protein
MSDLELKILPDVKKANAQRGSGFLIAGILSAIGASICCVGPLGVARPWGQRCVDRLPYFARTLPAYFYRIDTTVPWVRLLSSLFGTPSLFT